jgi:hypothetical protein
MRRLDGLIRIPANIDHLSFIRVPHDWLAAARIRLAAGMP